MPSTGLAAGIATGVGSLPHRNAAAAAASVLRCLPELPSVPQLPARSRYEQLVAQPLHGIDGIELAGDGSIVLGPSFDPGVTVPEELDPEAFGGLLAFLEEARRAARPPARVKAQVTGPLTMGVALARAGVPQADAFDLAARITRARARAIERHVVCALPDASLVLFYDEPALVCWRDEPPLDREAATDLLSGALASTGCVAGVHVCGAGDLRLALSAGPEIVHFDVHALSFEDSIALARFLDGGGWVAWGAVPTHGPIGEHPAPLWKSLLDVWCELTRRGCDPVLLRTQGIVAPACGLAGHGPSQAERAMLLARELGNRVHDQAAATKLAVGA